MGELLLLEMRLAIKSSMNIHDSLCVARSFFVSLELAGPHKRLYKMQMHLLNPIEFQIFMNSS